MKLLYRFCIVLFFAFVINNVGSSQNNTKQWDISTQGREFWLAVPLNDIKAQPPIQLEFYVTSQYNTLVTLEVPGTGFVRSKKVKANEVVIFSTMDGSASYDFEIVTSQIADPRGIHITADQPVSVYMMNAKQVTADGYLALPVRTWGTEYIHCSYYDFNEFRPLAGGFIVVASEDNTEVYITLRGKGGDIAKTASGSKIGEVLGPILLKKGEVYNVKGDATTIGQFDLTGSKITANKPIGLISYHERTMLPVNNTDGRDHMCEMIPPVSAWGKKYASIEFKRDNKGDFFRVVASEPNTVVKLRYYDKTTKVQLGLRDIVLKNAGDFYEDYNTWTGKGATVGFNGTTVWEADKPILVAQYAYSANWDKGDVYDPFMVVLTPLEQYLTSSIFQTPVSEAFVSSYYSFIVEGDTTDITQTKLKSFVLDRDTVYKSYPQFLTNNIPGTNLYWGIKAVGQGAHTVTSKTRFGGYVYGFGTFNSYGWPGTLNTRCLSQLDTLPPVLTSTDNCGDYSYHATESRDFSAEPSDKNQHDQGIMDIFLIDSISSNYTLQLVTADKITPLPKVKVFDFKLLVKDRTKDAIAVFVVLDRAGNYVLDTVRYKAQQPPVVSPSSLSFQVFKADTTVSATITLTNQTQETMYIESVTLGSASVFSITGGTITNTVTLAPSDTLTVTIDYSSIKAITNDSTPDHDTLRIKFAACADEKIVPLEGRFVPASSIHLSTDALTVKAKAVDSLVVSTITISNPSLSLVHLQSISLSSSTVFTIVKGNVTSDYILLPLASHIVEVQYKPTSTSVGKTDYDTLIIEVQGGAKQRVTLQGTVATPSLVEDGIAVQTSLTMTATPNPADESVMVTINGSYTHGVHLRLYDAIGREITACSVELSKGSSSAVLPNISTLPVGAYRLMATGYDGLILSSRLLMIQR